MAIQILNAILLLSAGFIAGNFLAKKPTGEISSAITATRHAGASRPTGAAGGRLPASTATIGNSVASTLAAPETRTPDIDLADYLMRFRIGDVHEACAFAQDRFLDQKVARHARFVNSLDNSPEHRAFIAGLGRRLAEDEKFWVGKGELALEDGAAKIEVIMDSHAFLPEAADEDKASCFRAHVRLNFANGRDYNTVLDACADQLVTKNRNYYLNWEAFGEAAVGRKLSVAQIPLPESNGAELEFMRAETETWMSAHDFRWESVPLQTGLSLIDATSAAMAQNRAAAGP